MYVNLSSLDPAALNDEDRYVYEIRADVADLASPRVCNRHMLISISLATNPATKIPNNVMVVVQQDDGSSFPDLKAAIAAIKEQLGQSSFNNEFQFMLGEEARRFLMGLHASGGFKEVFTTAEINTAAQYLLSSNSEDVIVELETSGRDVVTIQDGGHITVNWGEAQRYIKI